MNAFRLVAVAIVAVVVSTDSASAATVERPGSWVVGSIDPPSYLAAPSDRWAMRTGDSVARLGSFRFSALGLAGAFSPWVGTGAFAGARADRAIGGFLVDVPLGGFRFTGSLGAVGRAAANDASAWSLSTRLELGYEFDGRSRLSLGVTRSNDDRPRVDDRGGDSVTLRYSIPIGF